MIEEICMNIAGLIVVIGVVTCAIIYVYFWAKNRKDWDG